MDRWVKVGLLVGVLVLGYCYGSERASRATSDERVKVLETTIAARRKHSDSVESAYQQAKRRASAAEASVRVLSASRGRAVASTDSAMARVDTLLVALPDTLRSALVAERTAFLTERLKSDSVILSLESTVSALKAANVAADSVISAQASELAVQAKLVKVLESAAHPSFLRRSMTFARHAAVGAAVMAVAILVR